MVDYKYTNYAAGLCNIGPKEIKKRYAISVVGFILSSAMIYIFLLFNLNYTFFILTFFPLFLGFIGFFQGYLKFCVANAYRGIYDLSDIGGGKGIIRDDLSHREDIKHGRLLIYYSLISSFMTSVIIILIRLYL